MFRVRIEIPCDADGQLSSWWRLAHDEGYNISFENCCLVITGNGKSQSEIDKITAYVQKHPFYSICVDGK